MKGFLPTEEGEKSYRVAYAVHTVAEPTGKSVNGESQPAEQGQKPTHFIGLVTLISLSAGSLALPENLMLPGALASTTLAVELAYTFLPIGWGKGYATESLGAVFESCKRARTFWTPFSKLYVRALVHGTNPPSMRVMDKSGMKRTGTYEWNGDKSSAGARRERDIHHVFGKFLLE
jgi:hypothetical protein